MLWILSIQMLSPALMIAQQQQQQQHVGQFQFNRSGSANELIVARLRRKLSNSHRQTRSRAWPSGDYRWSTSGDRKTHDQQLSIVCALVHHRGREEEKVFQNKKPSRETLQGQYSCRHEKQLERGHDKHCGLATTANTPRTWTGAHGLASGHQMK